MSQLLDDALESDKLRRRIVHDQNTRHRYPCLMIPFARGCGRCILRPRLHCANWSPINAPTNSWQSFPQLTRTQKFLKHSGQLAVFAKPESRFGLLQFDYRPSETSASEHHIEHA